MIASVIRGARRKLHTIVSTEIIKPSSPTPSHLQTYNLSVYDQFIPSTFTPLLLFYSKSATYDSPHDQILHLKNSLSHILTKYYPFAGRHAKIAPTYVDCNDHGAELVEASIDDTLSNFLQHSKHEDLDPLFPHERTWNYGSGHGLQSDTVIPLAVKVNHFECGGVAVAVSLSHKIADAYSLAHFLKNWAKTTRAYSKGETSDSSIEPHFVSFKNAKYSSGFSLERSYDCVTRSFMFTNAKINELKIKIRAMTARAGFGMQITNPTRVEVITWLLYKCAVGAANESNLGSFKSTCIRLASNLRDKMIEPLPGNSIGNFLTGMEVQTVNETELKPELLISELRKQKKKIRGIKNIEAAFAPLLNRRSDFDLEEFQRKYENTYICTSICGYPVYGIDFGWGAPIKATVPGHLRKNSFIMMDASNREGIEVLVCLGKQDMDIVERDPELLLYADISLR